MTRLPIMCIGLIVVILMFAGQSYANVDPATILGVWLLDEGSGNTTADASGNGNDGTLMGAPAWAAGKIGSALRFTGSGTYVTCGNPAAFNTGVFSVSFWYNFPATQSWNHMVSRGQHVASGTPGSVNWGVMMYSAEQRILYETYNNTGWTAISADSTAGAWHHVVATFDGTTMQLYHDGQSVGTQAGGVLLDPSRPLIIGGRSDAGSVGGIFNGSLDEVGYFSAVLTAEDVQMIMTEGLSSITGNPRARRPDPKDGASHTDTWITLSWTPGDFAVSHDVYLGESFDDVNSATTASPTFRGNQTGTFYVAGFPGFAYPDGLVPGTTYYWRIDEVNTADPNSPWKGNVWRFSIPSQKASNPNPPDGAKFMPTNVTLSWAGGLGAKLHTVYFGDNRDTVANAAGGLPQAATTYTPIGLQLGKTYYWRVDEFGGTATFKGDVWSFTTTLPGLGTAVAERWNNIATTDLNTLKNDPRYPNNPDVTETVTQFAWDGPDTDNYGGRIHGWLYVPATGNYTFWLNTDDQGELWLSTDDDSSNVTLIARESTYTAVNTWNAGEEQSKPISLTGGQKYYIMALWKEGTGGDHCQVAWQGPAIPARVIIAGTFLSPYRPLSAYGASPANGATNVTQTPTLAWKPGLQAVSHEVYFGTDADAVRNATKTSSEYKGVKARGSESYNPGKLLWETTYYWRVDEVNNTNPASPWVGSVWSFTTAGFAIIDDFESYDAAANQIWYAWHDGLGYGVPGTPPYFAGNGTGAAVGDETTASFTEQTIVHGGKQSMPLNYDNNKQGFAKYSQAELTLTTTRDWTDGGAAELSIWFRGRAGSVGSFVEGPVGTYTMTASGADIWNQADQFHFAYKTLTGVGSIEAQVLSVDNTDPWAKAGVMIRETLTPGSKFAAVYITPANGCRFQARTTADAAATSDTAVVTPAQTAIKAPYWVKLERDAAGNFRGYYSANGTSWTSMTWNPQSITMGANVYIGLALTSHNNNATCTAKFSNVKTTGTVGALWAHQDIGIASNAAEPLYVAVSNAAGQPAVLVHPNPAAATTTTWTEWVIPLQSLQGITLNNVDRIAVGLGTRGNQTTPGGSGKMYFDDIRLYRPRTP